ncbi:MAG: hypothetical protein JRF29_03295 [Deltaproteobacteria bacterium]|nr:hypothetical protein [Deltaproteobacteria bacterium]
MLGLTSLFKLDALMPLLLGTFLGVMVGFIPGLGGTFKNNSSLTVKRKNN